MIPTGGFLQGAAALRAALRKGFTQIPNPLILLESTRSNSRTQGLVRLALALGGFALTIFAFFAVCLYSGFNRAQSFGETALFVLVFCAGALGLTLRLFSRLPLYRQGRIFTLGLRALKGLHLKLYLASCFLIAFSVLALGALNVLIRPAKYRTGIGRRVKAPVQYVTHPTPRPGR